MKFTFTTIYALIFLLNFSFAQPVLQKQRVAGSNQNDNLATSAFTSDGGIILGGSSAAGISGDKTQASRGGDDFWIVKYDSLGKIQWDKTIGGSATDNLASVAQTADGGYILGGTSSSGISGDKTAPRIGVTDYWVIKLDKNHNIEWDKTFNPDTEFSYILTLGSIEQTTDGGYIMAGTGKGDDPYSEPLYIVKLNADGSTQWENSLNDFATGAFIHQTSDGGYIIGETGYNTFYEELSYDARKLDANGNEQWRKNYKISEYPASDYSSYLSAIVEVKDGYILGGSSDGDSSGAKSEPNRGGYLSFDYWLIHTDKEGNQISDKTIGGSGNDFLTSMYKTKDGGIILGGYSSSGVSFEKTQPVIGGYDFWTVKLDKNAKILWDKTDGGTSDDILRNIIEKRAGVYVLTGTSSSPVSGDKTLPSKGENDYWSIILNGNISSGQAATSVTADFIVSPNPAKDVVHIQHTGTATFLLVNQAGSIVSKQTITGNGILNARNALPGVYTIVNMQTGLKQNVMIIK